MTWKPNVTVAAVIMQDNRFLLVEELTSDGIRINQPAGHLEPNESLIDAAIREVREETCCEFIPQGLLGIYMVNSSTANGNICYLRFAFFGKVSPPDPSKQLDEGIIRTLWLSADEIEMQSEQHRSPLVLQCIHDYLAGKRLPLESIYTDPSVHLVSL